MFNSNPKLTVKMGYSTFHRSALKLNARKGKRKPKQRYKHHFMLESIYMKCPKG